MKCSGCKENKVSLFDWLFGIPCIECFVGEAERYLAIPYCKYIPDFETAIKEMELNLRYQNG